MKRIYSSGQHILLAMVMAGLAMLSSCSKNDPTPVKATTPVLYSFGQIYNTGTNPLLAYWRDTVAVNLTDGTDSWQPTGMVVSGTDVYVSADGYVSGNRVPAYWKNKEKISLALKEGVDLYTSAIDVVGSDVYVSGYLDNHVTSYKPILWKNGTLQMITDKASLGGTVYSVKVRGTDVYAAGYAANDAGQNAPILWKNGSGTFLPLPSNILWGGVYQNAIAFSGTDVYVVGYGRYVDETNGIYYDVTLLWKNGAAPTVLVYDNTNSYSVYPIRLEISSTNDVYVFASPQKNSDYSYRTIYWKNGALTELPLSGYGGLYDAALSGSDMFVNFGQIVYKNQNMIHAFDGVTNSKWHPYYHFINME